MSQNQSRECSASADGCSGGATREGGGRQETLDAETRSIDCNIEEGTGSREDRGLNVGQSGGTHRQFFGGGKRV